tara:strand:+ start:276 stop:830 length:555 start_codon:yes stop_codon:yes gene_type:complete
MKKRCIILTWSGFQDHEVVYPYYRLLGEGFSVSIIADSKDDKGRFYGIFGLNMPCHVLYSEFYKDLNYWMDESDLIVLPGGVKSLEKLRLEDKVIDFISLWNQKNKIISSTCHGAQLLISAMVTKNKKISGYYSLKDDINNSGGTFVNEPVVIDGNIITSPHYDHMGIWMEETLSTYYNHYKNK